MSEPTRIDVNTFALRVNRSKRQVYKHIKTGRIPAIKPNRNSSYLIEEAEVARFLEEFGDNGSQSDTVTQSEPSRIDTSDTSREDTEGREQARTQGDGSHETILALVERVAKAERRTVELELLLRQHQNLLTENAESLQERRAGEIQAQEQANALAIELESLKTEMSAREARWAEERQSSKPWWKRALGI